MGNEDWYRNKTWNDELVSHFVTKLKRSRRKEQYLRIQASTLAEIEPEIALGLLDQYFELNDDFDHAQAYCDRASAFIALGKLEEAIEAYKLALKRESQFPRVLTDAYIEFPMLVAKHKMFHYIAEANEVLDDNKSRLIFPIDHFRWHATKAIFESESGNKKEASIQAGLALDAAKIKKSGFRFHQKLGLVGNKYKHMVNALRSI